MKYKTNRTTSVETLERIAEQENEFFIRIFYDGRFVNYLFDPSDVTNLGLGTIFEMIDPDPELLEATTFYTQALEQRQAVLTRRSKKKKPDILLD
jgi:hypothetical protein